MLVALNTRGSVRTVISLSCAVSVACASLLVSMFLLGYSLVGPVEPMSGCIPSLDQSTLSPLSTLWVAPHYGLPHLGWSMKRQSLVP